MYSLELGRRSRRSLALQRSKSTTLKHLAVRDGKIKVESSEAARWRSWRCLIIRIVDTSSRDSALGVEEKKKRGIRRDIKQTAQSAAEHRETANKRQDN